MELAIYFSDLERLLDMDSSLRVIDTDKLSSYVMTTMFVQNPNVYDYSVNLTTVPWIQAIRNSGIDFSRLYFGQEFCANLIPPVDELEQAYYFSRQMDWNFTYVTGVANTEASLERIRRNLDKLKELDPECEVVINDWAMFHILPKEYPSFKVVVGRLLNKQTRLNLFMKMQSFPMHTDGIETPKETIRDNQLHAYADISLSNPDYLEEIKKMGVVGADLDMTPQGVLRPDDGWGLTLGFYYPWAYIAVGRNCATAGTADKVRTYVMTDRPCGKLCRKINCSPSFVQFEFPLVQRGPALFIQNEEFSQSYIERPMIKYERLIYEPYIPV